MHPSGAARGSDPGEAPSLPGDVELVEVGGHMLYLHRAHSLVSDPQSKAAMHSYS